MRNHHPIVVNNTEYSSIADAAKKLHVPLSTALTRLRAGASPEDAFKPEDDEHDHHQDTLHQSAGQHRTYRPNEVMTQKKGPVVAYKLDGHLFHDAASLATAYHADPKMVQKRLDAGWSVAQSVGVAPQPRNAQQLHLCDNSATLVVDGTLYGGTQELAHTLHLDLKLLVAHLHAGTPAQEAVDLLRASSPTQDTVAPLQVVSTTFDALPQEKEPSEVGVVVQGQTFASEGAAARAFGVARSTFYKRRAKGMSLTDSLGISTASPADKKRQKTQSRKTTVAKTPNPDTPSHVVVAGVSYPSERAAAKSLGLPLSTFYKHRAKGMTIDAILAARAAQGATIATVTTTVAPTASVQNKEDGSILVRGVTYPSERAAAKANGVPPSTFYKRKNKGMSLFEILGIATTQAPTTETQVAAATERSSQVKTPDSGVFVEGKHYPSERAAAKAHGVPPSTFYKKRNLGHSLAAILGVAGSLVSLTAPTVATDTISTTKTDPENGSAAPGVIVQGKHYPSERAAAKAHGIPLSTFYKKKNRGEDLLTILGIEQTPTSISTVTLSEDPPATGVVVHGKPYASERAAAKAHGIPLSTFYKKRQAGVSLLSMIPQALPPTAAPAQQKSMVRVTPLSMLSKPIVCNGVSYPSHRALAKAFNLSPHSLRYRLETQHLSPEEAVGLSTEKATTAAAPEKTGPHNANPISFRNVNYPSFRKLAEAFGVDPRKAHQRVARGWTLEKALEAPAEVPVSVALAPHHEHVTERKEQPLPDTVYFQGTHYPSISAFAKAYNQPVEVVEQRLRDGWTRAESVGLIGHSDEHDDHKRMTDHFLVEGQAFKSVRSLAEHYQIKDHVLRYRLQSGWNVNQAVGLARPPQSGSVTPSESLQSTPFPVMLNNVSYPSVTALAQAYQLSPRLIRQRLKHGWSVRAAVGLPEEEKPLGELKVGNHIFKSIRALASHFHISESKVRYRLKVGWSASQAVEHTPSPDELVKQGKSATRNISDMLPIMIGEQTFHTAASFARHYGQNVAKVSGRLRNGWTPQEAVGLAKHQRAGASIGKTEKESTSKAKFTVDGKGFSSARELASAYKLSSRVVQYRLAKGATPAQAVGLVPWSSSSSKSEPVTFDGKTYPNYLGLCKALSLNYNMFMSRLGRGWSVQRAVVTPSAHAAGMDVLHSTAQTLRQTPADIRLGKKHYSNIESFAKDHSLESTVVYDRLSKGWTPEQVVGQAPPPHWH